jgi:hypothetical protein
VKIMPRPRPPNVAIIGELSLAMSMAARKKPSSEVSCTGDSEPPNGPMMMAAKPATTEAMTQLAAARNSGE